MANRSRAQSIDIIAKNQGDHVNGSRVSRDEEWGTDDDAECGETKGIDANQPCGVTHVLVYTCSVHRRNEIAGPIGSN